MLITLKPWWTRPLPWEQRQTPGWRNRRRTEFWTNRNDYRLQRKLYQQKQLEQTMWLRVRQKMMKPIG
ncbi:MAG: hypothetical protein HUJ26_08460 [Planctomycetaceae bacterium]|nr:hypothetical protein [Planctomycetaceae bacterium]